MSPMNNRRMVPMAEPGILDFAPGAAAAYSLRNLSLSYSGPVVTVRRSTDNAEADFTASEVSDGTLAAWCSGGDGFVKQWWSQTGSNNASQSTAGNQPQIVDSGTLVTVGGKPSLRFSANTSGDCRLSASLSITDINMFAVAEAATFATSPAIVEFHKTTYRRIPYFNNTGKLTYYQQPTDYIGQTTFLPATFVVALLQNGTGLSVYVDGSVDNQTAVPLPQATDTLAIGNDRTAGNPIHSLQELLIYPTDMTALRTRIEGNLAWTYSL